MRNFRDYYLVLNFISSGVSFPSNLTNPPPPNRLLNKHHHHQYCHLERFNKITLRTERYATKRTTRERKSFHYSGCILRSLSSSSFENSEHNSNSNTSNNNNEREKDEDAHYPTGVPNNTKSCPLSFAMKFERYRIPLTREKDSSTNNIVNVLNENNKFGQMQGLLTSMKISIDRSTLERKYTTERKDGRFLWIDVLESSELVSALTNNNNHKKQKENNDDIIKGYIGVNISAIYWVILSNMVNSVTTTATTGEGKNIEKQQRNKKIVLALPNSSLTGLKQLVDITNWIYEEENRIFESIPKQKALVYATIDHDAPVPTVLLTATRTLVTATANTATVSINTNHLDEKEETILDNQSFEVTAEDHHGAIDINSLEPIVTKRMKSWVNRVLVKMEICPFTKSVTKSGQGLKDVGIPIGKIAYHYSNRCTNEIYSLFADIWRAISQMVNAGPSGKNGISSILLAAPQYDDYFKIWAGPIFTILEASVIASKAESIVGVVCFHPNYVTPDGNSWPGFGHMHSVPRLRNWLKTHDVSLSNLLSDNDVAAGGAYQRRTPHSTINVLRADQLEKAEIKRQSGKLYSKNIRRLYETGYETLEDDLQNDYLLLLNNMEK